MGMNSTQVVEFDALRSLGFGSISGAYTAVGTAFVNQVRLICFTNNTDGDMLFSVDAVTDHLFIPKNSFKLFDLTTNRLNRDQIFILQPGTTFYVKQSTAATTGGVYIECIWGQ